MRWTQAAFRVNRSFYDDWISVIFVGKYAHTLMNCSYANNTRFKRKNRSTSKWNNI